MIMNTIQQNEIFDLEFGCEYDQGGGIEHPETDALQS